MNLKQALRLLEITKDDDIDEVKRKYRDLVSIWHPDRFQNNKRLQEKTLEKLKEINLAFEFVIKSITTLENNKYSENNSHLNIVKCNHCGIRNRLIKVKKSDRILCGKCGKPFLKGCAKKAEEPKSKDFEQFFQEGIQLKDLEQFYEALCAFDHAIKIKPQNSLSWYWKSFCLTNLKCFDQALSAINTAEKFEPTNMIFWQQKAVIYAILGRYSLAIRTYNKLEKNDYFFTPSNLVLVIGPSIQF